MQFRKVAAELHDLRTRAVKLLFECGGEGSTCADTLMEYAERVAAVCRQRSSHSPVSYKRDWPMEFEWCFPNEVDPHKHQCVASMRASLPAVEALTAATAAFCCRMRAAAVGMLQPDTAMEATDGLRRCICILDLIDTWVPAGSGEASAPIFNASQWNRLRRQQLPLLLIPRWRSIIRANLHYQCILVKVGHVLNVGAATVSTKATTTQVLAMLVQHEASTRLLAALYAFLTVENYLLDYQIETAQHMYDIGIKELHRIKARCLYTQATLAVDLIEPDVAVSLATHSKLAWWAFDEAHKEECIAMMEGCNAVIADCQDCITAAATEESVVRWQRTLGVSGGENLGFLGLKLEEGTETESD